MYKSCYSILLVLISVCLSSCGEDSITSTTCTPETCLPGDTLRVQKSEHFEITIYNEGADGLYFWSIVDEFSDKIAEYIDYRTEETNPDLFGSPINQIWEYKAIDLGTTCAVFEYKRAIPEDAPVLETKNIVLIVE